MSYSLIRTSWIIRVRIAFVFSLLIFALLKLALKKAICSYGLGSHTLTRRPTENPCLTRSRVTAIPSFDFRDFITQSKALQPQLARAKKARKRSFRALTLKI